MEENLKSEIYYLLKLVGRTITVPTITSLACDYCNTLPNRVRVTLTELIDDGSITCDNGGWLRIVR